MPTRARDVKQKQKKRFIVPVPDTVVHPHAVVVHSQDALVALAAVVRPRGFVPDALFAKARPAFALSLH